ncbi:MAG: arginine--tRNA ligase [Candidatus Berkelbacteria bacterium]|nr:arginine--tRNA ligase [Candidatus Berkelbacteria bacterium]
MKKIVIEKINKVLETLGVNLAGEFSVDEPPKVDLGDWASNVALIVAGRLKENPRAVAEKIKGELIKDDDILNIEIAGPGFVNISLKPEIYFSELSKILQQKEDYGKTNTGQGKIANVEYVSANPTGPLHIGNARSGPIGETIGNVMKFCGYSVVREFYVNDVGIQIGRFGRSLYFWYAKKQNEATEFPEGGYPGEYIRETSSRIQSVFASELNEISQESDFIDFFAKEGLKMMVEGIKTDLVLAGIEFDKWSFESEILAGKYSDEIVEKLESLGNTVEKDGAIWFKRPDDPDLLDTESVLVKSDQNHSLTYFANDIAYHLDKMKRGAELMIDVWGSNHFGHIPRMKAALRALGYPEDVLEIILYQYVRLKKAGEATSMGKRLGNFVTLRAVIEAGVEPDAFKYFILSQNSNTPFAFDIELAADTTEKNPVFYIKYAHARICSILRKAGETEISPNVDLSPLVDPKELVLLRELAKLPGIVEVVATDFQIQMLPHFAYRIATLFHDFYNSCKVIGAETKEIETARLALIVATRHILASCLNLCGIKAPEKM